MATVNYIRYKAQSKTALREVTRYAEQDTKTMEDSGIKFVSGQNCTPRSAYQEFLATREMHHKESPVWFHHYTQSFHPDENITPKQAHDLAKEFASRAWPDSEVLISTHLDADHIHSHFLVNAVCYETGRMLRQGPNTLEHLRKLSDKLCMAHGFSVLPPSPKRGNGMSAREYRSAEKGQSWKMRLSADIDTCMRYAADREQFILLMQQKGYRVRWEDKRKNITYTTPTGNPCRDERLHEAKYLKEAMQHEFSTRAKIISGGAEATQQRRSDDGDGYRPAGYADREKLDSGDQYSQEYSGSAGQNGQAPGYAPHAGGCGETPEHAGTADGAVPCTGWEREREIFLRLRKTGERHAEEPGFDHEDHRAESLQHDGSLPVRTFGSGAVGETQTGDRFSAVLGADHLAGDLVRLGRALEMSQDAPQTGATHHHTDSKTLRKEREKKTALGHKADDREDEQTQTWQQTM
ncbi:MAG: relaxase/mobilization nuclease domain-containing protein [Oscillospiraceae bacterium]